MFYKTMQMLDNYKFTKTDSLIYIYSNPLFYDLIFPQKNINIKFEKKTFSENFFGKTPQNLNSFINQNNNKVKFNDITGSRTLTEIRKDAYTYLTNNAATVFEANSWELPDASQFKYKIILPEVAHIIQVSDTTLSVLLARNIIKKAIELMKWQPSFSTLVQFSQNYFSANWYQGGMSNMSILSTLKGSLLYTNYQNIKWESTVEWRTGFMSINIDTIQRIITNDDIFKIDSKLELKAKGNWAYGALMNFSTQFFDNFQSSDSHELKACFLTPIRLNVGFGMNYSYQKLISVLFAPLSYKLIYLSDIASVGSSKYVNPNLFGIEAGQNKLSEMGSSLTAKLQWQPLDEMTINSVFKFYTNYKKVEMDWETIIDFTINRYLSTRLLFNPRYDNTVIMQNTQKARIQLKELLSFGFNYKFR